MREELIKKLKNLRDSLKREEKNLEEKGALEYAVIFKRGKNDNERILYPTRVETGYLNENLQQFVTTNGQRYNYMLSGDDYSFGLRGTIGEVIGEKATMSFPDYAKRLLKIAKKHIFTVQKNINSSNSENSFYAKNLASGHKFVVQDRDLASMEKVIDNYSSKDKFASVEELTQSRNYILLRKKNN